MHNATLISSLLLTLFTGTLLTWLVIETLKEGREALRQLKRDNK